MATLHGSFDGDGVRDVAGHGFNLAAVDWAGLMGA